MCFFNLKQVLFLDKDRFTISNIWRKTTKIDQQNWPAKIPLLIAWLGGFRSSDTRAMAKKCVS